jgi:hypothetical protein
MKAVGTIPMKDDLPAECPSCSSDDLCIDNVEGMECMACGCWFDAEPDGTVIWARMSRPADMDLL